MRRRPVQNGGRPNHSNNGGGQRRHSSGGHHHSSSGGNRSRKNYPQLREKYINQAKDALSGGDRVMAEYYFQHADHCYRMMVEEGSVPRPNTQQNAGQQDGDNSAGNGSDENKMDDHDVNPGALPGFLTMGQTAAAAAHNVQQANAEPAQGQWEEN